MIEFRKSRSAREEQPVDKSNVLPMDRPTEEQMDWVDELYEVVDILRNRCRSYELRLKRLEKEVFNDEDEDDE